MLNGPDGPVYRPILKSRESRVVFTAIDLVKIVVTSIGEETVCVFCKYPILLKPHLLLPFPADDKMATNIVPRDNLANQ